MPQDTPDTPIGERVRRARRARGMSIDVLAGLIGRSKGWMSMVERGRLPLDKRADIAAIAQTLEIAADDLIGEPAPDLAARLPHINLTRLREVLHEYSLDDPPDVPVRPPDLVAADLRTLDDQLRATDYDAMMRTLPGVMEELHTAAHLGEPERSQALRQLITAAGLAVIVMRHFGHADLAWICGDRARSAAARLEDPVWWAAAAYQRAHARPSANRSRALLDTPRIADELEPHIGDDAMAHQVHGMLRLSSALAHQVCGDHDAAREQAAEAARLAARFEVPDDPHAWELFGVANVGVWRTTLAVEAGDAAEAMRISDGVDLSALASKNRRAALLMDRFRALHMLGRDRQAARELHKAERLSPAQVRHSPLVRETVRDMTAVKDKTLRGIAWRMGAI
ncbi:helix-turn-helix domain-containing protein [Nocardiopsis halophila]|uniref:helix-turn-helix domain-containing protein n=1 Tax=Nocardiopsis halophila TaxID=141692 RepID=UPI0003465351|nr:helix-turn-helix transcriptional regulator [Nocardiopsis halophila]